jgi:hypothetical protein
MSTKNPKKKTQPKVTKQKTQQTVTKKATNKHKGKEIEGKMQEPQPSTSGLNNKGGPIELSSEDSQLCSDVELTDDEDDSIYVHSINKLINCQNKFKFN